MAHRLAVIVPCRADDSTHGQGRSEHLALFVPYMQRFLGRTGIDFRLLVVEQTPGGRFNKGALMNAGFCLSRDTCDYLVLHDVDQLPEHPANSYARPRVFPRHLCTASSQHGYRLPYRTYVGGALLMTREQYAAVNGFSNRYRDWGCEDDDMAIRIRRSFWHLRRLSRRVGRYRALPHSRVTDAHLGAAFRANRAILDDAIAGRTDFRRDGLSSLEFRVVATSHQDYDRYLVEVPDR
jgi:hypothetical protein